MNTARSADSSGPTGHSRPHHRRRSLGRERAARRTLRTRPTVAASRRRERAPCETRAQRRRSLLYAIRQQPPYDRPHLRDSALLHAGTWLPSALTAALTWPAGRTRRLAGARRPLIASSISEGGDIAREAADPIMSRRMRPLESTSILARRLFSPPGGGKAAAARACRGGPSSAWRAIDFGSGRVGALDAGVVTEAECSHLEACVRHEQPEAFSFDGAVEAARRALGHPSAA